MYHSLLASMPILKRIRQAEVRNGSIDPFFFRVGVHQKLFTRFQTHLSHRINLLVWPCLEIGSFLANARQSKALAHPLTNKKKESDLSGVSPKSLFSGFIAGKVL